MFVLLLSSFSIAYSVGMRVPILLLALTLAACGPKNQTKSAVAAPAPAPKWADLEGAPYTVSALQVKGKEFALPATRRPTMQFGEAGRVAGMAGVNRYTTEATLSEAGVIAISPKTVTTKMAGPPAAMELEAGFLEALGVLTRVEVVGGTVRLTNADRTTRIELTR